MTQKDKVYEELVQVRPFGITAGGVHQLLKKSMPKVSVSRALNELKAEGKVVKLERYGLGTRGRKTRLWRATYK